MPVNSRAGSEAPAGECPLYCCERTIEAMVQAHDKISQMRLRSHCHHDSGRMIVPVETGMYLALMYTPLSSWPIGPARPHCITERRSMPMGTWDGLLVLLQFSVTCADSQINTLCESPQTPFVFLVM